MVIDSYHGEIVYFYACDLAYELRRAELNTVLGHPLEPLQVGPAKRSPLQRLVTVPRAAKLDPVTLDLPAPLGRTLVQRTVKVLPVGAVSIMLRIPFTVTDLDALLPLHHDLFVQGLLPAHARELTLSLQKDLQRVAIRPVAQLQQGEDFTVFCLTTPESESFDHPFDSDAWFQVNRDTIAALVTQEPDSKRLSRQEAKESTRQHLSYYRTDLLVVDWEAALLLDRPSEWDETLYVLEVANFQLEELIAYDRLLDAALDRSYSDLQRPPSSSRRHALLQHLREVRIDLARFSDELSNITKLFGDWHPARQYEMAASRFHLSDWRSSLDDKLKTLDSLYELLKQEQNHRIMVVLEAAIVVMFLIDIIMLIMGLAK